MEQSSYTEAKSRLSVQEITRYKKFQNWELIPLPYRMLTSNFSGSHGCKYHD